VTTELQEKEANLELWRPVESVHFPILAVKSYLINYYKYNKF